MEYRFLGSTGYNVSRLCYGSLTLGYLGANLPLKEGSALLREAFELGINFIDTAQYYANYDYIRGALHGWDQDLIITSKTYAEDKAGILGAIEEARFKLNRDKIEIFLLHEQADAKALQANLGALEVLHQAKARGLIGAVGISTHNPQAAIKAAQMPEVEVIHALINQKGVGIIGKDLTAKNNGLKLAKSKGKGVYGMKAIGGGSLIKDAEPMLKWAFSQDYLDSIAVGMRQKAELRTNIAWLQGKNSSQEAEISKISRRLCLEPGDVCTRCGNCVNRCGQQALIIKAGSLTWEKEKCILCGYCIPACPHFFLSIV